MDPKAPVTFCHSFFIVTKPEALRVLHKCRTRRCICILTPVPVLTEALTHITPMLLQLAQECSTLKENKDNLLEEIDALTEERQQLKLRLNAVESATGW